MMNDEGKSDRSVVPEKSPNKVGQPTAEAMEGRDLTKGNAGQQNVCRTQCRENTLSALDRVREVARKDRSAKFTALFHHITLERLRAAFMLLRKKASPGVDGITWQQYEAALEDNLQDLHERLHRGAYRAKPSRRVMIPKPDGRQRPLGIASLEDKIVQRAVVEVLNAIYEVDFLGFSYGFRPRRSQHNALDALNAGIYFKKVNYVLDADIRGFFDAIDHGWIVHRAQDRGQEDPAAHPEMADRGCFGGWGGEAWSGRYTAGGDDIAASCQHLPALRSRSVDRTVAEKARLRRYHRRAVCGRLHCWISEGSRREALPGGTPWATAGLLFGVAP